MFGDLDWPLNASRGLSTIAEFLVLLCPSNMGGALSVDGRCLSVRLSVPCLILSRARTEGHRKLKIGRREAQGDPWQNLDIERSKVDVNKVTSQVPLREGNPIGNYVVIFVWKKTKETMLLNAENYSTTCLTILVRDERRDVRIHYLCRWYLLFNQIMSNGNRVFANTIRGIESVLAFSLYRV